jgi:hypothetical protein
MSDGLEKEWVNQWRDDESVVLKSRSSTPHYDVGANRCYSRIGIGFTRNGAPEGETTFRDFVLDAQTKELLAAGTESVVDRQGKVSYPDGHDQYSEIQYQMYKLMTK